MRKFVLGLIVLIYAPLAKGNFSLKQVKDATNCGSPCSVTVTALTAGSSVGIAIINGASVTFSSATNGTYTHCSNCANGNATTGFIDGAYATTTTTGATTIQVTFTGSASSPLVVVWEIASPVTISFDVSGSVLRTTNCTSCSGVGLSLTGTNDAIITVAACGGTCSAISAGYTSDLSFLSGDGYAHALNTSSGTAPNWTQSPTSNLSSFSIAFKEPAAVSHTAPSQVYE